MINLLSNQRQADIRAARTNIILLRYMGLVCIAGLFLLGTLYVTYTLLEETMRNADASIADNDIKADVYSETRQNVEQLSSQLSNARTILDEEVPYSELFVSIGQVMPPGTVLGDTTFATTNFNGTPLSLTAYARSATEASVLQSNFQSSPLFSEVNLNSTTETGGVEGYPVVISLTVTINKTGI